MISEAAAGVTDAYQLHCPASANLRGFCSLRAERADVLDIGCGSDLPSRLSSSGVALSSPG
jgi:hypothetical protein